MSDDQLRINRLIQLIKQAQPMDKLTVICKTDFFDKLVTFEWVSACKQLGIDATQYRILAKQNLLRKLKEKKW